MEPLMARYRPLPTEFEMAKKYANGMQAFSDDLVKRWNDGTRPERRRILAALRAVHHAGKRDLYFAQLLLMLPVAITSKI